MQVKMDDGLYQAWEDDKINFNNFFETSGLTFFSLFNTFRQSRRISNMILHFDLNQINKHWYLHHNLSRYLKYTYLFPILISNPFKRFFFVHPKVYFFEFVDKTENRCNIWIDSWSSFCLTLLLGWWNVRWIW